MSVANNFADLLSGKLKMQCTVCGANMGGCDCWTKCRNLSCTWSYRKGTFCPNCHYRLSSHEREILETLSEDGGFATRDVAKHVTFFGHSARTHSGAVRSWLLGLKRRGFVDLLDDQKPDAWKRTPAGTLAVSRPTLGGEAK